LGTRGFVHYSIVSTVERVEFLSDRVSYIVLRGLWYNTSIIVLNMRAPSKEKSDGSKHRYMKNYSNFSSVSKYHIKIIWGDFNAKLRRENIFKPTVANESLHQDSNDNGFRIVNFATSENLFVNSTKFPHRNIHK